MRSVLLAAVVVLAVVPAARADPARVGYPSSIGAIGDSITRAFNTSLFPFVDGPANSWATGTTVSLSSQHRRILAAGGSVLGGSWNGAVSGAEMADLESQARQVVARRVDYVTILMGANDVCAPEEDGMTPTIDFEAQFGAALSTISSGLPDARISVVSVPRIYQLWNALKGNPAARSVWTRFSICQSMLASPTSTAQEDVERRMRVDARNREYNAALRAVCAEYVHCDYDDDGIFDYAFQPAHVSTRDYFHPSISGQAVLAAESWAATFDFRDSVPPASGAAGGTGASITITASDDVGVRGIEYRIGGGSWTRYTAPFTAAGSVVAYRAVDVNGNLEATRRING